MKNKEFDVIKAYVDQNIDSPDLLTYLKKTIQEKISKYSVSKILNILKANDKFKELLSQTIHTDDTKLQALYFQDLLNYCPICGKPTASIYCSSKCSNHDEVTKDKMRSSLKNTLKERYGEGIQSTSQLEEVRAKKRANWKNDPKKAKQTCLLRYGKETYNNSELRAQTNLKKYGGVAPLHSKEVQQKSKETCLKKYGCEHPLQNDKVKEKLKKTCLEKYGTECVLQNEDIKNKCKNTKLEKYGHPYYSDIEKAKQTKFEHYHGDFSKIREKIKATCLKRYGVAEPNHLHFKNYELLNEEYVRKNFIVDGIFMLKQCMAFFNMSESGVTLYKRRYNITEPNDVLNGRSNAEIELAKFVSSYTETLCNSKKIIDGPEIDIYLPEYNLAIEYNGIYWHSADYKPKNYHLNKTNKCKEKGIHLFHIFEFDNMDIWKSMILHKLGKSTRIYARKCELREISNEVAHSFIEENHLDGFTDSSINLGLYYNNELVQVMTFKTLEDNSEYDFELIRLCSLKNTAVIGGASKLFKHFLKEHPNASVVSYANKRFSDGNIYEILGFKLHHETAPNYFYANCEIVLSQYQCQKRFLSKILEEYHPELSELENMELNGFFRIFDCGNYVFEYNSQIH